MPNNVERTVAKGVGKLAAVKARGKGLRGVFTKLAEQHREAISLLNRIKTTNDLQKRRELWTDVRKALLSHERAEIAEVYPVLMGFETTADIVSQHALEAGQLEATLEELEELAFDATRWEPEFERMITMLKGHIAEEEDDFFPRAQEVMGEDAAKELEAVYLRAQERELARVI